MTIYPKYHKFLMMLISICLLALAGSCRSDSPGGAETQAVTPTKPKTAEPTQAVTAAQGTTSTPQPTEALTQAPADTQMPVDTPTPTPTPGVGSTIVSHKDGMVQMYVPEGEFLMGSDDGDADASPAHTVYLDAYWIDQTEITNAMYSAFVADTGYQTDAQKGDWGWAYTGDDTWEKVKGADWQHPQGPRSAIDEMDDHPAAQMSWNDAAAYCEWAGRHLPTEAQWEKAARGTEGMKYPWGNQDAAGNLLNFADSSLGTVWANGNVDDEYRFTAPAGSYPDGGSPYGALDMAGNVWEWTADWYAENYYANSPLENPVGPSSSDYRVMRGGSWDSPTSYVGAAIREHNTLDNRSSDFGFRCAASADEALAAAEAFPTETPGTEKPETDLAVADMMMSDIDGMVLVYVPEGEFLMGSEKGDPSAQNNEFPQHPVYLGAYWIDQTEVTNAMYEKCVAAGTCVPPLYEYSYNRTSYYGDPEFDGYPVILVNWDQAQAYCEWAGRRLPTEAEWEKAARGTDGRLFPWGNQGAAGNLLNFADANSVFYFGWADTTVDDGHEETAPAGNYPDGASPYGTLDMAGTVWEWVADWYSDSYYARSPYENPQGPSSGSIRVLRGGSWMEDVSGVRAAKREDTFGPDFQDSSVGFRCAFSPESSRATTPVPTPTTPPTVAPTATHAPAVSEADGMTLVYVPQGEFIMGSTVADIDRIMEECPNCKREYNEDEIPQHTVFLDAFWIDQTEVTNTMYAGCVSAGACEPPKDHQITEIDYYDVSKYANFPVVNVDWLRAQAYCEWVGRRLPSEAEWEKAARGTDGRTYPWGEESDCKRLNYMDCAVNFPTRVGSYPSGASPYGALDMVGNVTEWAADWYDENYFTASPSENPQGPSSGSARVLKGGSWYSSWAGGVRTAVRDKLIPHIGYFDNGFRCASSTAPAP